MFRFPGRRLRGAAVAAAVICAYGAGAVTGGGGDGGDLRTEADGRSLLDEAAVKIGQETAAGPVDRGDLDRAAIDGMLRRLGDKWARYYSAREFDDFQGRLEGRYSGVGVWLGTGDGDDRRVRVASVQPGSAAERAGVRVGDVITRVGGAPVDGWDIGRVAAALRGGQDTGVQLTVDRDAAEHRFRLVRATVASGDVTVSGHAGGAQIIRVGAFTRDVGRQVRAAVTSAPPPASGAKGDGPQGDGLLSSAQGGGEGSPSDSQGIPHPGGILLDLRGNPGGLLAEAVETASAFLPDGLVVTYERPGRPAERMNVTRPGDTASPLVVLVDAGTASAAEVVAGSLRDRNRAVIVGSRTYGKGSVQEPIRLSDGSAIELTVGRYRTPNGRNLDGVGIEPDVAVSADRPPRAAEQRAQAVLRGLLATLPEAGSGGVTERDRG